MQKRYLLQRRSQRRQMMRRSHRRLWHQTRRLMAGTAVLLLVGGTAAVYKLAQSDLQRIEEATGRAAETLAEGELQTAMRRLGIQTIPLTSLDAVRLRHATEQ